MKTPKYLKTDFGPVKVNDVCRSTNHLVIERPGVSLEIVADLEGYEITAEKYAELEQGVLYRELMTFPK